MWSNILQSVTQTERETVKRLKAQKEKEQFIQEQKGQ